MALRSLKTKGLADQNGSVAQLDPLDRSDGQDIILADAGFGDFEDLSEALEAYPDGKAPTKLRAVSAALGILAGNKRRPTISYCLNQFLTDKARGRDTTKKDWVNYERQRRCRPGDGWN
jgi:hypothetical protein